MGRSLYGQLRRRFGRTADGITRRDALKAALAAAAGTAAAMFEGCAANHGGGSGQRVVVVGAGFAGLAAADRLLRAGYSVTVLEARSRVSGRVLSFHDFAADNVEGGGELIGSNHPMWLAYRDRFKLEMIDVEDFEKEKALSSPMVIGGKVLDDKQAQALAEEMDELLHGKLTKMAEGVVEDEPWKTPKAAELDGTSTGGWVEAQRPSGMARKGLEIELEGNNGVVLSRQSLLGNLTQIKGGGLEKYWDDSEVFRCKGGNMQLAQKLAESVGMERIRLNTPVARIEWDRDRAKVVCADGTALEAEHVVLAVPPGAWGGIAFSPALPEGLAPQMGVNVKHLSAVKGRFWLETKHTPNAETDEFVSMTWESTDGQAVKDLASLTCFSGGPAAQQARRLANRDPAYAELLEKCFPGYAQRVVKTRFMDWPAEKYTGGGYSFPAPGQITALGPTLKGGLGRITFAGEHVCYKFVGYMEGALTSGIWAAGRIARHDGVLMG